MEDFKYTVSLIENFFNFKKIQRSLQIIWEQEISGWETWLQIEFSTFISLNYINEIEWHREYSILPDGRKDNERTRMAADFIYRRKGYKLDSYNVLEFKQHASPKSCFSNMYKDVEKIEKAKASSIDMRSFWVVGIHHKTKMTKSEIKNYIAEKYEMDENLILTKYIPNTQYAFTIF